MNKETFLQVSYNVFICFVFINGIYFLFRMQPCQNVKKQGLIIKSELRWFLLIVDRESC